MKYLLALTLFLVSSMCMANDAAKRESVDELMRITGVDSMVDAMYAQMDVHADQRGRVAEEELGQLPRHLRLPDARGAGEDEGADD